MASIGYKPFRMVGLVLLSLIAGWYTGCSTEDQLAFDEQLLATIDDAISGRLAYLSVVSHNSFEQSPAPLSITAQFVDFRGVEVDTVRHSLDLWIPEELNPSQPCVLTSDPPDIDLQNWSPTRILLMHAGTIQVEGEGTAVVLQPRRMPDLFPFFRGYTYGTANHERPNYPPRTQVILDSPGGRDVGPFTVEVALPDPLVITHVNGQAIGSSEAISLSDASDLTIAWTPSVHEESVHILLTGDGLPSGGTLRCCVPDTGFYQISEQALQTFNETSNAASFRLTVSRAYVQRFALRGFDVAEAVGRTEHSIVVF